MVVTAERIHVKAQADSCGGGTQCCLRLIETNRDYELLNFASGTTGSYVVFSEVIDRMAEACRAFTAPVVSGNVSFYNETEGRGILPTPVIGMVGLLDVRRVVHPDSKTTATSSQFLASLLMTFNE